jgi:DNA-binding transcriptional MocR family regulator
MLSLNVVPRENRPLTDQIVMGVKRQIDDRQLRPGTRLPSIRTFAETHGVSRFTVVEAYDRLVAMGCLQSRRGAGFYVAARSEGAVPGAPEAHQHNEQLVWLIRRLLEAGDHAALAGGPWLPNSWQDESGIRQALSALARKNGAHLLEYGNPFGYLPLREHLALTLADIGIAASPAQILLTQGTSQALDLVMRYLLQPGDCALVDDPGYYNLFGNLRMHGVEMLAVPRRPDGPVTWRPSKRWPRRDDRRSTSRNPPCRTRRARAPARTWPSGCCRPPRITTSRSSRTTSSAICSR